LLYGAIGFTSLALSSVFPGISTPFQGFAATFISGTPSLSVTHNHPVIEYNFVRPNLIKRTDL
jgi:hypothetical protein